ncbi:DUF3095 domain-containing protein [Roseovarius ramblicola]|uniref:DUF3095 domain-containing protein n=1 Tax=Roseovarius ramblicola TaxID=2022336 RepID=A0ABV5I6Z2_9RHOB
MQNDSSGSSFFNSLPTQTNFAVLSNANVYTPLPEHWWVGTSDIIGSTEAVSNGRYKTVNMVAAAVISAQINAHDGASFPFIFGGDGAGFAVPEAWRDDAAQALAAVKLWAREEFDIGLRIGMVRVSDVRAAGFDVMVARFQVSDGVDYSMFSGGGLTWAEAQMKAGANLVPEAPAGTKPDLTGLSCRWNHLPSRYGTILSVIILPCDGTSAVVFSDIASRVLSIARNLMREGHPVDENGPGVRWPPIGAALETYARRGGGTLRAARRKTLLESFVAWTLIKTGLVIGGFDARRYRRMVGNNADFRKFEDGLKMTLDCDPATEKRLRSLLVKGSEAGIIRYGIHTQSEAMMTCIVPSILADNHVHFVDGASGGYTKAAQTMKGPMKL